MHHQHIDSQFRILLLHTTHVGHNDGSSQTFQVNVCRHLGINPSQFAGWATTTLLGLSVIHQAHGQGVFQAIVVTEIADIDHGLLVEYTLRRR